MTADPDPAFWRGRRVLLTGHTGFKGAWLSLWLTELGADVTGFALAPDTEPSLYELAGVDRLVRSEIGDVRDAEAVEAAMSRARPDVLFHLAAQSLVRRSYADPLGTVATNVVGTAHVLDAARRAPGLLAAVVVTSDKCYENRAGGPPYREDEPMGGHDPYSASKGCAELLTTAWRRSFFGAGGASAGVASVRAGNVIGGGDWAADRLVPDCVRAFETGRPVPIRNPAAVRPWQHVLEPLAGYLRLAERLVEEPTTYAEAWNFGPSVDDARPVSWLVDRLTTFWGEGARWERDGGEHQHEAGVLEVDASKARSRLGWTPRLGLEDGLRWTVEWYRRRHAGEDAAALTLEQLSSFARLESSA